LEAGVFLANSSAMRPRAPRGFTLIEMMTVVAIAGVLAGITVLALTRLKTRGNFSSATGDFIATLRVARAEAFARGDNTVVVVDSAGGNWWAIEDIAGSFSLAAFSPATPAPSPARLIYTGALPPGTSFGPAGGFGQALTPPYSGIPTGFVNIVLADGGNGGVADISVDGGSAAPNFKYCSFCRTSDGFGAIVFLPSGGANFNGIGPTSVGQQISIQSADTDGGPTSGIIDFAIVAATGASEAVTIQ
jgi:prepilin-type N-terminal cleavage/methylation domain-containing protein